MALSYAQLESVAMQGGFPAPLAPIAAAIALAESSGNPSATNPNDNGGRQTSWGLWQISNGDHNYPYGDANWADPVENARLAWRKYTGAGNSWAPWGTYTSGAYRRFLQGGVQADPNGIPTSSEGVSLAGFSLPDPLSGVASAISGGFSSFIKSIEHTFDVAMNNLLFGLAIAVGLGLMGVGTVLMVKETPAGTTVVQATRRAASTLTKGVIA